MANNAGNSKWVNIGDNKRDGVNITIAAIRADGTIGGRFTADKGWYVKKGSLPGIGKPMAMPAHLSAKAETDCIDGEVWENNICKTLEELKTANTDTTQVEQENREETQEEAQAQVKTETQAETKVLVKTEDPLESEAPEELDQ